MKHVVFMLVESLVARILDARILERLVTSLFLLAVAFSAIVLAVRFVAWIRGRFTADAAAKEAPKVKF